MLRNLLILLAFVSGWAILSDGSASADGQVGCAGMASTSVVSSSCAGVVEQASCGGASHHPARRTPVRTLVRGTVRVATSPIRLSANAMRARRHHAHGCAGQ